MILTWARHATALPSALGRRRCWRSTGPYRVVHLRHRCKAERDRWTAERRDAYGWKPLQRWTVRRKTREAMQKALDRAQYACERDARQADPNALAAAAASRELARQYHPKRRRIAV